GWPDRAPCGPAGPYTDVITPRFGVPALAAAIFERRRSGLGQHIDLSQVEGAIRFIEPLILDALVNGRTAEPAGMASAVACPHGVYRAAGTERFIAISAETAPEWRALLGVAPLDRFATPEFDALDVRQSRGAEIEAALAAWVRGQDAFALEGQLVAAGVPAAAVLRMSDLHRDAQLEHRGFFVPLEHSVMGRVPYDGLATRFSAKQTMLHRAAPALGEHTAFVLRELVGMDASEIASYAAADALT
ncbi:MAG: CoA transferase, partial [Dehalococcoidia bacterium]